MNCILVRGRQGFYRPSLWERNLRKVSPLRPLFQRCRASGLLLLLPQCCGFVAGRELREGVLDQTGSLQVVRNEHLWHLENSTSSAGEHFKPGVPRQIMTFRVCQVWSKLRAIPALQNKEVEGRRAGEELDVFAVAGRFALQFGKREVVRFEPEKQQPAKRRREQRQLSIDVVLGNNDDPDMLQVNSMFVMQP